MAIHSLAGKAAPIDILIDVAALEKTYYERRPMLKIRRNSSASAPAAIVAGIGIGHWG